MPTHARDIRPGRARRGAFTLIELILALALIVLMLAVLFTFFWQTVEARKMARFRSERTLLARQVLSTIEKELRGCVGFDRIGFPAAQGEQRLIGTRRNITFLTSAMPGLHQYRFPRADETPPPAQHDLRLVSYRLWVDPNNKTEEGEPIIGGIVRAEKKTLNQFLVEEKDPLDIRNDLWSPELAFLEFRYFDGIEWDTKWDVTDGNSLPQLIQVTIGFKPISAVELENGDLATYPLDKFPYGDNQVRDDRFSVVIRLPAADKFFASRMSRVGKQMSEQLGVGGAAP